MFKFNQLRQIHVEISSRCQASCPMCPRTLHGGIDNPTLKLNNWSLDDFKRIINNEVLEQITSITFCGSFGDPIVNNDFLDMCRYLKETKTEVCLSIHTNGSMRTTSWWKELAQALPKNHYVVFALDGLEDTHALYRVGTIWSKVIENAQAFIDAGGNADWMFIRFKHNQHQVAAAEELSKKMGFKRFTVKNTRRFETDKFKVVDKNGVVTHYLEQPTDSVIKIVDRRDLETFNNWTKKTDIDCYALNTREVYIDANYTVLPCCFLAAFIYTNYDKELFERYGLYHEHSVVEFGAKIQSQLFDIINELGGMSKLNTLENSLKEIINEPVWQTLWKNKWDSGESMGCIALCSASSPYIHVDEQWVEGKGPNVQV